MSKKKSLGRTKKKLAQETRKGNYRTMAERPRAPLRPPPTCNRAELAQAIQDQCLLPGTAHIPPGSRERLVIAGITDGMALLFEGYPHPVSPLAFLPKEGRRRG